MKDGGRGEGLTPTVTNHHCGQDLYEPPLSHPGPQAQAYSGQQVGQTAVSPSKAHNTGSRSTRRAVGGNIGSGRRTGSGGQQCDPKVSLAVRLPALHPQSVHSILTAMPSRMQHCKDGTLDTFDSLNEMEALQALFDLGALPPR